jgi:hypothetical protein
VVETAAGMARTSARESGEADLVIGNPTTGHVGANEQTELTSCLGARDCSMPWLGPSPPDSLAAAYYRVQKLSLG